MSGKRLLIVGGTGFIGRHLSIEAQRRGYEVTSISPSGERNPIPGVRYLVGDMTHTPIVKGFENGLDFEYVVKAGGYIDHSGFWSGGQAMIDAHLEGTRNLIASCNRDVLKRYVGIGSSDAYGEAIAPQREDMREQPISPYSFTTTAVGHLLQMLWRSERFPAVELRLFLAYGPGQGNKRFLPQIITGCLQNKRFPVSVGAQLRDFCYIDDVVNGILASLEAPNVCGEVINIASGQPISIRAVIERVRNLIGDGEPLFGRIPYRRGESMALYADITKAKSLLNWEPRVSLDEGLQMTVDWYRNAFDAA